MSGRNTTNVNGELKGEKTPLSPTLHGLESRYMPRRNPEPTFTNYIKQNKKISSNQVVKIDVDTAQGQSLLRLSQQSLIKIRDQNDR